MDLFGKRIIEIDEGRVVNDGLDEEEDIYEIE